MIKLGYKKGKAVMFTVLMPSKVEDYALPRLSKEMIICLV